MKPPFQGSQQTKNLYSYWITSTKAVRYCLIVKNLISRKTKTFQESMRKLRRRSGGVLLFQGKWATRGRRWIWGWFNIILYIIHIIYSLGKSSWMIFFANCHAGPLLLFKNLFCNMQRIIVFTICFKLLYQIISIVS